MKIVGVSDLHGMLPEIPPCDLLLIGGDITPVTNHAIPFQAEWLDTTFRRWLEQAPARKVVGVAGNHDYIFQDMPGAAAAKPAVDVPAGLRDRMGRAAHLGDALAAVVLRLGVQPLRERPEAEMGPDPRRHGRAGAACAAVRLRRRRAPGRRENAADRLADAAGADRAGSAARGHIRPHSRGPGRMAAGPNRPRQRHHCR